MGIHIQDLNVHSPSGRPEAQRAFSLLEVLVSTTVFLIILGLVAGVMGSTSSFWLRHRDQATAFETANAAFDTLTRSIAQAVLNTYWEVDGSGYARSSELNFVMGPANNLLSPATASIYSGEAIFFQATIGRSADTKLKRLPLLLNSLGYFVRFDAGPDLPNFLSSLVSSRHRYRLYEWLQPTENCGVYFPPSNTPAGKHAWFRDDLANNMVNTAVLGENVISLILMAEYSDADGKTVSLYSYDSRDSDKPDTLHRLPARIRVLMAVIDESSAIRLAKQYGTTPPPVQPDAEWFQTPGNFATDLIKWEDKLRAITPRIDYRIFTTTVSIQNAKWSSNL